MFIQHYIRKYFHIYLYFLCLHPSGCSFKLSFLQVSKGDGRARGRIAPGSRWSAGWICRCVMISNTSWPCESLWRAPCTSSITCSHTSDPRRNVDCVLLPRNEFPAGNGGATCSRAKLIGHQLMKLFVNISFSSKRVALLSSP